MSQGFKSIEEISKVYGIKSCYLKNATLTGELDFYRFGEKTKYIKLSDFEKWVESKRNFTKMKCPPFRAKDYQKEGV